jgi:hypothetical protein
MADDDSAESATTPPHQHRRFCNGPIIDARFGPTTPLSGKPLSSRGYVEASPGFADRF